MAEGTIRQETRLEFNGRNERLGKEGGRIPS